MPAVPSKLKNTFAALASRRHNPVAPAAKAKPPKSPRGMAASVRLRRRGNPDYAQFSAYLPQPMSKRLKQHLLDTNGILSAAIEEAVGDWLHKIGK